MHTISPQRSDKRTSGHHARLLGVGALLKSLVGLIAFWRQRQRERFALSNLDDRLLRDIGISRKDANAETTKPFWRS